MVRTTEFTASLTIQSTLIESLSGYSLISTHLKELGPLLKDKANFVQMDVKEDEKGCIVCLYKGKEGVCEKSRAIEAAEKVGLDSWIVARAKNISLAWSKGNKIDALPEIDKACLKTLTS